MSTDTAVVRTVVRFLGCALLGLIGGLIWLTYVVVGQGSGAKTVDPAAVGAVGAIATLTGTIGGYVGGLLSSTRSTDANQAARDEERAKLLAELEELRRAHTVDQALGTDVDTAVINADSAVVNAGEEGHG